MAGKVSVRSSFDIILDTSSGRRDYGMLPTAFEDTLNNPLGPTPGALTVPVLGIDVNLSALSKPAWCRIRNLDPTNKIHVGPRDPQTLRFYPMIEVRPQQWVDVCLSAHLFSEYGTGTGTPAPDTNTLHIRADNAPCKVDVACFND